MILVTGGTGFIGQALIRHLVESDRPVRTLIRPSPQSPTLPRGLAVDAAVTSLQDTRGLRAAMVGVDTIFHLAGDEWRGASGDLMETDIQGTQAVAQAAADAGVARIFYLSHLGADRASAYPVFKAKAIAEDHIRKSGVDHTILRCGLVYGPQDGFTTGLAHMLRALPYVFLLPGDGDTMIQPLWVEDLVLCMAWALDDDRTRNQTYELGGPEYLRFFEVVNTIMQTLGLHRTLVVTRPPYLRALTILLEYILPGLPTSVYWLDYLATHRTCSLDTIPRVFGLMPARFSHQLDYLRVLNGRPPLWQTIFRRKGAR